MSFAVFASCELPVALSFLARFISVVRTVSQHVHHRTREVAAKATATGKVVGNATERAWLGSETTMFHGGKGTTPEQPFSGHRSKAAKNSGGKGTKPEPAFSGNRKAAKNSSDRTASRGASRSAVRTSASTQARTVEDLISKSWEVGDRAGVGVGVGAPRHGPYVRSRHSVVGPSLQPNAPHHVIRCCSTSRSIHVIRYCSTSRSFARRPQS
eukprot:scaffold111048_cov53-Phaeocystis_antarctica.AAC.2